MTLLKVRVDVNCLFPTLLIKSVGGFEYIVCLPTAVAQLTILETDGGNPVTSNKITFLYNYSF